MIFLLVFLAGASTVFAYAPFELFPFSIMGWGVLFYLLRRPMRARRAALLGFTWGLGAFIAGLCWLYIALHRYGGMSPVLAALSIFLFCAYLAVYPAFSAWLFVRLRQSHYSYQDALLAAACWTLGEWLRGTLFTGFPWLAIGYTQTPPHPLAGWVPILGVYGTGFLLTLMAGLLVLCGVNKSFRWRACLGALAVFVSGSALYAIAWTHPVGQSTRFSLLQTNIAQEMKWQPGHVNQWLALNAKMVQEHPAQVMVMPETSLPLIIDNLPEGYLKSLRDTAQAARGDVIIGAFTLDQQGRIFNSAITQGVSPTQHYSKNHLVPFGEFKPPFFDWFFDWAKIPMADQARGGSSQPPLHLAGQEIAMNICYEDVFGEELIHVLPQATILLNMSNLAWYGDSHAQPQHLQIAQIRALEMGRPMLRATNTGMTASIAPNGRVMQKLPAFTAGALVVDVKGYQGLTPYARWGNTPVLVICLGLILWGLFSCFRHKTSAKV